MAMLCYGPPENRQILQIEKPEKPHCNTEKVPYMGENLPE